MRLIPILSIIAAAALAAEDVAPAPAATPEWSWKTKLGVFFQNTASHNAERSLDSTIAGTNDSMAYKLSGEATAVWKEDLDRVEQKLEAAYGQIRTKSEGIWKENADNILYSATYERTLTKPQFLYANATAESVFSGRDPDNNALDPVIAKGSVGYGHRYEGLLPEKDALVWRVGVYARKRWESRTPDFITDVQSGPEWYLRYERQQSADVSYFGQYDGFSEWEDMEHITNLVQAGLSVKVAKLLTVEVKARAYYETRPNDKAAKEAEGYNEWSVRQEALVGLVWETGSK